MFYPILPVAAALRAAADIECQQIRKELLAIADELKAK
jgi:glycine cleavage system regulatory protein